MEATIEKPTGAQADAAVAPAADTESAPDAVGNGPATCNAAFVKVAGACGCGKTQALVDRAAYLVEHGVDARSIGVFAATRSAADELTRRLQAALPGTALHAQTPYDYAVRILSDERAKATTGRNPRILLDFETRILAEDLKVVGIKAHRMREMLKFFFKQWSELGDERDDFLLSTEEHLLYDALEGHLKARDAMLFQELTNIACKYLREGGRKTGAWRYDYVLADDFQNYSRATQQMLEHLAWKQLFACGNEAEQVLTTEAYPYAEGFSNFIVDHEGSDTAEFTLRDEHRQAAPIARALNELAQQPGMQPARVARIADGDGSAAAAAGRAIKQVKWTLPNAEFLGIADYIERRVHKGERPVHPRSIYVSVPNALWGRALAKVLADRGVPSSLMVTYHALTGDPRRMEKSANLRAFCGLNLAAEPQDATAWRSWCGFGDYLTRSNHWCRLEEYAEKHGMGVVGMLDRLSATGGRPVVRPEDVDDEDAIAAAEAEAAEAEKLNGLAFLGADVLVRRYREGRDLIARCEGKRGFSVVNNLIDDPSAGMPQGFAELVEPISGTETAGELYERAQARAQIQFSDADAVRIGLPQMACGLEFDTVVMAGMVDGFLPSTMTFSEELTAERQNELRATERRAVYACAGKAESELVLSFFARDEANTAEAMGMQVRRIRAVNGKRMAILAPSAFIAEMGDTVPGEDANL